MAPIECMRYTAGDFSFTQRFEDGILWAAHMQNDWQLVNGPDEVVNEENKNSDDDQELEQRDEEIDLKKSQWEVWRTTAPQLTSMM